MAEMVILRIWDDSAFWVVDDFHPLTPWPYYNQKAELKGHSTRFVAAVDGWQG